MKKWFLLLISICVCLMATSGFALTINDTGVVGTIEYNPDEANANADTVTYWANYLLNMGENESAIVDEGSVYDGVYATSSNAYAGTLTGGLRIDGFAENTSPDISGYEWVLGKYDGQNAGYVLFNIADYLAAYGGNSIPVFSNSIWGGEGQYALSNVTVFGGTSVPEPSTMLLLGVGLVGLVGVSRKVKKQ